VPAGWLRCSSAGGMPAAEGGRTRRPV